MCISIEGVSAVIALYVYTQYMYIFYTCPGIEIGGLLDVDLGCFSKKGRVTFVYREAQGWKATQNLAANLSYMWYNINLNDIARRVQIYRV